VGEFEGLYERRKESDSRAILGVLLGVAAMMAGASLLVEAVRRIAHIEAAQTRVFGTALT